MKYLSAQIWTIGSNSCGQLGLGHKEDRSIPSPAIFLDTEKIGDHGILDIDGGANHTVFITSTSVFVSGSNSQGQLGLYSNHDGDLFHPEPQELTSFMMHPFFSDETFVSQRGSLKFVCCGWESTFIGFQSGQVMAFGCNRHGQLGIPANTSHSTCIPSPTWINFPQDNICIQKVHSSVRHTLFLEESGIVFGCGSGRHGQLGDIQFDNGNGDKKKMDNIPLTRIPFLEDIVDIACGFQYSCALNRSGKVYMMGTHKHVHLESLGDPPKRLSGIIQLDLSAISPYAILSQWSTVLVMGQKQHLVWGRNDHGQSGFHPGGLMQDTHPVESTASRLVNGTDVPEGKMVLHSFQNKNLHMKEVRFGSEHGICLTESGECLVWGWNEHGNLGLGHLEDVFKPVKLSYSESSNSRIVMIGAGCGNSFFVTVSD